MSISEVSEFFVGVFLLYSIYKIVGLCIGVVGFDFCGFMSWSGGRWSFDVNNLGVLIKIIY